MFRFGPACAILGVRPLTNRIVRGHRKFYYSEDDVKTAFRLLVASLVAGFSYTQSASAQYPGFIPIPQPSATYSYNSPGGYYRVHPHAHHHRQYYSPGALPNYGSMYGGGGAYIPQPVVVPSTPNVYTTNNYYQAQPRNHPWHLGHYLLGN
jgi:hypothetical protein